MAKISSGYQGVPVVQWTSDNGTLHALYASSVKQIISQNVIVSLAVYRNHAHAHLRRTHNAHCALLLELMQTGAEDACGDPR